MSSGLCSENPGFIRDVGGGRSNIEGTRLGVTGRTVPRHIQALSKEAWMMEVPSTE